jgi:hypothetical protein
VRKDPDNADIALLSRLQLFQVGFEVNVPMSRSSDWMGAKRISRSAVNLWLEASTAGGGEIEAAPVVLSKDLAVFAVDAGADDIGLGAQGHHRLLRHFWVVEVQGHGHYVVAIQHIQQSVQIAHHSLFEREAVEADKRHAGQQQ